jgi:hypothetical protein
MASFLVAQAVQAHSTAAPTTIQATLNPTAAGSLLIAVVAAAGGTPAAPSSPAGWIAISPPALNNGIGYGAWALPNAPVGFTALTVTLNGTPQGAALNLYELQGLSNLTRLLGTQNSNTSTSATTPAGGIGTAGPFPSMEELCVAFIAHVAATATYNGSGEFASVLLNNTSTGGTTNVTLDVYLGPVPYNMTPLLITTGLSASVAWLSAYSLSLVDGGGPVARITGNAIMATGAGYSGPVGGY